MWSVRPPQTLPTPRVEETPCQASCRHSPRSARSPSALRAWELPARRRDHGRERGRFPDDDRRQRIGRALRVQPRRATQGGAPNGCREVRRSRRKTSRLLASKALHAAWTVPLPTLRRGEVASALLVAPDLEAGPPCRLSFVTGYIDESKTLTRALVEPPTKDSVELSARRRARADRGAGGVDGGRAVRGRTLALAGLDVGVFFRRDIRRGERR